MTTNLLVQNTAVVSDNVPVVSIVKTNSHPQIPSDQKMFCLVNPQTLDSNPDCPVIECAGLTFWAYSYIDNRFSMSIVGYDIHGHQVKQWELQGVRYIWQIDVDVDNKMVTFFGQDQKSVQLTWKELQGPVIVLEDADSFPKDIPFNVKMATLADPDKLDPAQQCPVVVYGNHTFWPFSYIDNRNSLCIISFCEDGQMHNSVELKGSRYIWKIEIDEINEKVNFIGQSKQTVSMSFNDFLMPEVKIVPTDSNPPIPAGSKQTVTIEPFSGDQNPNCPIIVYKDYVFWAFSYIDNRVAMNIIACDCDGKIIKQWEKPGSRYLWQITTDPRTKTVTFWGQSNAKIVMNWSDLILD
jgi:hypothetical protein